MVVCVYNWLGVWIIGVCQEVVTNYKLYVNICDSCATRVMIRAVCVRLRARRARVALLSVYFYSFS